MNFTRREGEKIQKIEEKDIYREKFEKDI
jgi:hypothetical protein